MFGSCRHDLLGGARATRFQNMVKNDFNVKPDTFKTSFLEMTYYFISCPLPRALCKHGSRPVGWQNLPDPAMRGDAQ